MVKTYIYIYIVEVMLVIGLLISVKNKARTSWFWFYFNYQNSVLELLDQVWKNDPWDDLEVFLRVIYISYMGLWPLKFTVSILTGIMDLAPDSVQTPHHLHCYSFSVWMEKRVQFYVPNPHFQKSIIWSTMPCPQIKTGQMIPRNASNALSYYIWTIHIYTEAEVQRNNETWNTTN